MAVWIILSAIGLVLSAASYADQVYIDNKTKNVNKQSKQWAESQHTRLSQQTSVIKQLENEISKYNRDYIIEGDRLTQIYNDLNSTMALIPSLGGRARQVMREARDQLSQMKNKSESTRESLTKRISAAEENLSIANKKYSDIAAESNPYHYADTAGIIADAIS